LRGQLRHRLATSPLMDVAAFVADLETAYRTMWRAWCDRQAAR
jgi:predicted O-linked N-acetylglucosamine transferase (SPINDLY family)